MPRSERPILDGASVASIGRGCSFGSVRSSWLPMHSRGFAHAFRSAAWRASRAFVLRWMRVDSRRRCSSSWLDRLAKEWIHLGKGVNDQRDQERERDQGTKQGIKIHDQSADKRGGRRLHVGNTRGTDARKTLVSLPDLNRSQCEHD